jgi:hypothetical protein
MEIGKSYRVDSIVYVLNSIFNFADGSCMFIFSNDEEDEFIVTSYKKVIDHYCSPIKWRHIMSNEVTEV